MNDRHIEYNSKEACLSYNLIPRKKDIYPEIESL